MPETPDSTGPTLTWLGTAGLQFQMDGHVLLVDPYYTRLTLAEFVTGRAASRDEIIRRHLPLAADAVLITHSHFDHLLDAPVVERLTGATIVGSSTTYNLCRGRGVPEDRLVTVRGGELLEFGPFRVKVYRSRHSRFLFGRVPLEGEVDHPITPKRAWDYRVGPVFIYRIEAGGVSTLVLGSADLEDEALSDARSDILCPCVAGHQSTHQFLPRILKLCQPKALMPIHYDNFFLPYETGVKELPGASFRKFVQLAREEAPLLRAYRPDFFEPLDLRRMAEG